jgi:hypothetical protein
MTLALTEIKETGTREKREEGRVNYIMRWIRVGLAALVGSLALAPTAQAAGISIFSAPDGTYQNGTNAPCVFYIHSCSKDPKAPQDGPFDWPTPAGPTDDYTATELTNTFDGADYLGPWKTYVGSAFILGFDINQNGGAQTLTNLTIKFYGPLDVLLSDYTFGGLPLDVPANANGNGYADYIFAAGCDGTIAGGTGVAATCDDYAPFLVPNGTVKIVMTYNLANFNDGAEQIFAIQQAAPRCTDCGSVPEPATGTLLALGAGLVAVASRLRRRTRA